ncbi:unnamed protein product [Vitrella brassicaformis CCMP3155]|uniref:Uncharacterized protein n=1 Tax=Vitrella brassicaformis (strain CCMP3155) TaxID=1169540 RepID=A0A0G4E9V1_VITBC|nr:unnamed protein product [Vitrella brassicaformis CCMP3155]|eukprot:CEL91962.1 unnamed protein product [Vitrella brassicaformis CCMP3155]
MWPRQRSSQHASRSVVFGNIANDGLPGPPAHPLSPRCVRSASLSQIGGGIAWIDDITTALWASPTNSTRPCCEEDARKSDEIYESSSQTTGKIPRPLQLSSHPLSEDLSRTVSPRFSETFPQSRLMQPTRAAPSSQPLFQPAELFDMSLPISKMVRMAMANDDATRGALRSQIVTRTRQQELLGHTSATVTSTLLNGVQQHVNKAISRLGLDNVLAFDIDGDVEGGLRVAWLLEQGTGEEWRAMGRFLRVAFIHRLTPADSTLPLRLPADSLPTATALHQLPIALAIYSTFSRQLTKNGVTLALQQANNGAYRVGNVSFRVVPHGDLPAGHRYADGYKRTDPVIRWDVYLSLSPSFSAFLLDRLLSRWSGEVAAERIDIRFGRSDPRCERLLTSAITEDQGIPVHRRYDRGNLNSAYAIDSRRVIVSGFRPNETVAAFVWVGRGSI